MKTISKVWAFLCLITGVFSLYSMEVADAMEINTPEHTPVIINIVNDTGIPLHVRLRGGKDGDIQVLMPEYTGSLEQLKVNNETFRFPTSTIFSLDISCIAFPLRLRLWPITYTPSEDKAADKSTKTSELNRQNSLYCKLIYPQDIPAGYTTLLLQKVGSRITSRWVARYDAAGYQYVGALVAELYNMNIDEE